MPLGQSIRWEIPPFLAGCGMVALGAWLRRETLASAEARPFPDFFWEFLQKRYLGFLLLLCPIEIALLRSLAVINNAQQLIMGWSVFSYLTSLIKSVFGCSDQAALAIMMMGFGLVALMPTAWLIYQLARKRS